MNHGNDKSLEYLLDLNGVRFLVDENLGIWVKFDVWRVSEDKRKQGIRYSLSLHNRDNARILGFDNAHSISVEQGGKIFDHWHRDEKDHGRAYHYLSAGKLVEDFWLAVDKKIKGLKND